ncbi:MAG: hypothetical protein PWP04_1156, partial [Candidatus Atribacteria bacterium]|nr:hypothetical protein [Candidatus Atribacteria bacterium]
MGFNFSEQEKSRKKIILIDGNSLAYRAFYALPPLQNSKGRPTGATYGFIHMVLRLMEDYHPFTVVVAFDHPEKTFRHQLLEEYKAQRKPMPDELKPQLEDIKSLLQCLRLPTVEIPGFEADDILGSLKNRYRQKFDLFLVSSDLDLLQLLEEGVFLLKPIRGVTQLQLFDPSRVKEKWGVEPSQVVDWVAMAGDPSDNLKGIPGVGDKTAASLLEKFGSWEGILQNLSSLSPKRKKVIEENRELVAENIKLVAIRCDLEIDLPPEVFDFGRVRWDELEEKLDELELHTLKERLEKKKPNQLPEDLPSILQLNDLAVAFARGEEWFSLSAQGEIKKEGVSFSSGLEATKPRFFWLSSIQNGQKFPATFPTSTEGWFYLPAVIFISFPCLFPWFERFFTALERRATPTEGFDRLFFILDEVQTKFLADEHFLFLYRDWEEKALQALLVDGKKVSGYSWYSYPPLRIIPSSVSWDLPLFRPEVVYRISFASSSVWQLIQARYREAVKTNWEGLVSYSTFYHNRFIVKQTEKESLQKKIYIRVCLDELVRIVVITLFRLGVREIKVGENELSFLPPSSASSFSLVPQVEESLSRVAGFSQFKLIQKEAYSYILSCDNNGGFAPLITPQKTKNVKKKKKTTEEGKHFLSNG